MGKHLFSEETVALAVQNLRGDVQHQNLKFFSAPGSRLAGKPCSSLLRLISQHSSLLRPLEGVEVVRILKGNLTNSQRDEVRGNKGAWRGGGHGGL